MRALPAPIVAVLLAAGAVVAGAAIWPHAASNQQPVVVVSGIVTDKTFIPQHTTTVMIGRQEVRVPRHSCWQLGLEAPTGTGSICVSADDWSAAAVGETYAPSWAVTETSR